MIKNVFKYIVVFTKIANIYIKPDLAKKLPSRFFKALDTTGWIILNGMIIRILIRRHKEIVHRG